MQVSRRSARDANMDTLNNAPLHHRSSATLIHILYCMCSGATGLVGSRLAAKLAAQGNKVKVLTRNVASAKMQLSSYPSIEYFAPADWAGAIAGCTGVVNLAGEPIGTRWTPEIKAEIKRSRLNVTRSVVVNAGS